MDSFVHNGRIESFFRQLLIYRVVCIICNLNDGKTPTVLRKKLFVKHIFFGPLVNVEFKFVSDAAHVRNIFYRHLQYGG